LSVINKVLVKTAPEDFEPVARSIAVKLAHLTAREVYQLTERAVAHALSDGRNALQISDYHADAESYQLDDVSSLKKNASNEWLH
jgi:hypothetical protein